MPVLGIDVKATPNDNYSKIITKCADVLSTWYLRQLTVMGTVLIVNALVSSLFVFLMQVEIDPPLHIYARFDALVHNFIWKGKGAKIPASILKMKKTQGGLRLCNLQAKNKALKISWLFRTEASVQQQLTAITPDELGTHFWDCAINPNEIGPMLESRNVNSFWKDVVKYWFELTWEYSQSFRS